MDICVLWRSIYWLYCDTLYAEIIITHFCRRLPHRLFRRAPRIRRLSRSCITPPVLCSPSETPSTARPSHRHCRPHSRGTTVSSSRLQLYCYQRIKMINLIQWMPGYLVLKLLFYSASCASSASINASLENKLGSVGSILPHEVLSFLIPYISWQSDYSWFGLLL